MKGADANAGPRPSGTGRATVVTRVRTRLGRLLRTRMMVRRVNRTVVEQGKAQVTIATTVGGLEAQVATVTSQVSAVAGQIATVAAALDALETTVAAMHTSFTPFERASSLRALEHGRFSAQFGAMEQRVGRLEQMASDERVTGTEASIAEAVDVLTAVRREHERVRVRLQVISAYEERLRRVESAVVGLIETDPRQPV